MYLIFTARVVLGRNHAHSTKPCEGAGLGQKNIRQLNLNNIHKNVRRRFGASSSSEQHASAFPLPVHKYEIQVLAALCNLSLSGCIGQDPARFLKAVDVGNLVSFLCSADVTYRLFGAVTLGNIASDVSLQAPIVRGGALTPLITIANAADLETQRCIAYSLCNLSANPARRGAIISEGGLPPLISLACSDHPVDQRAALATLRAIAADPDYRRAVVEAGALEAFSLGAR